MSSPLLRLQRNLDASIRAKQQLMQESATLAVFDAAVAATIAAYQIGRAHV